MLPVVYFEGYRPYLEVLLRPEKLGSGTFGIWGISFVGEGLRAFDREVEEATSVEQMKRFSSWDELLPPPIYGP
jgi:hypothetical protein